MPELAFRTPPASVRHPTAARCRPRRLSARPNHKPATSANRAATMKVHQPLMSVGRQPPPAHRDIRRHAMSEGVTRGGSRPTNPRRGPPTEEPVAQAGGRHEFWTDSCAKRDYMAGRQAYAAFPYKGREALMAPYALKSFRVWANAPALSRREVLRQCGVSDA